MKTSDSLHSTGSDTDAPNVAGKVSFSINPVLLRLKQPLLWVALATAVSGPVYGQPTVPTTFALPSSAADTSRPGFVWRIHQVATTQRAYNSRAEDELAGLLGNNIADPNAQGIALAPASSPSPSTAPIAFEIPTVINLNIFGGGFDGNFTPDEQMPGLPGLTGSGENAAAEVLTWLDLPVGTITLGVNSDDGFRMTIGGANPSDRFAVEVGVFDNGRPPEDTLFSFNITRAGLYAMRCLWQQGCCGGSIEIFSVQPDGTRILLNDIANGGIRAYRGVTAAARAYARKLAPAPGIGLTANAPVTIELVDGATPVAASSVGLVIDGTAVVPVRSKSGNVTSISYTRPSLWAAGSHTIAVSYTDGVATTVTWPFTVLDYQGPNGNFYEFVRAANISWADAETAAQQRTFGCGNHGHLVTLTSADEDVFVELLRQEYLQAEAFPPGEAWAGGFQLPNQLHTMDGWFWVNNEGPLSGFNGGSTYANWNIGTGEPNDCCVTVGIEDNEENYLGIGTFGPGLGWNDDDVSHGNIVGYVVEYERLTVAIDIRPGNYPNPIYLDAPGKLPVAILSSPTFNASTVNPATITFGRTGTEAHPVSYSLSDVNGDGLKDLVCQFNISDTGLMCGDTAAILEASTSSGCPLRGSDSVQILRCPPYALGIQSMTDVNHLTDVYLTVTPILAGHTAPTVAQNLVLKSFDIFGKLRWAKTLQNLPLTPNANGTTTADLKYTDMAHGQNVKAQMTVKDSVSGTTEVLNQQGRVLFRPDVSIANLSAPSQSYVGQVVNIFASINELKGDLGATASVYLEDGTTIIDSVNSVSVPALGSVGVAFSANFQTVGTHQLTLVITNENPGDYDLSNNQQTFTIQVVQPPLQQVPYCANYQHYEQDYQSVVENPFWISIYHDQYTNEYTYETLYIPAALQFPLARVTLTISADGVQQDSFDISNIPGYSYDYGCGPVGYASIYLGDNTSLFVQSVQDTCYGYQQTYASFNKYGAGEVYYSAYFDKVWGTGYTNSYNYSYSLMNATTSVKTRFVVQASSGAFGGDGSFGTIYWYPFDYEYDYYEYDYNDGLYDEHVTVSDQGKSTYDYNCDITVP